MKTCETEGDNFIIIRDEDAVEEPEIVIEPEEELSNSERRHGPCELCERYVKLTFHHLIPKAMHGKNKFKKMFTVEEMRTRGLFLCKLCHSAIHEFFPSEKLLAEFYNTKEALLAHEGIARHIIWAAKQKR